LTFLHRAYSKSGAYERAAGALREAAELELQAGAPARAFGLRLALVEALLEWRADEGLAEAGETSRGP
jgi:hypothetical protein